MGKEKVVSEAEKIFEGTGKTKYQLKYVIVGGGDVGRSIADFLKDDYIIIEKDEKVYEELSKLGYNVLLGDARDVIRRLQLRGAKVVLATNDDETNLRVGKLARELGAEEVIARIKESDRIDEYARAKIRAITCDRIVAAELMYGLSKGRRRYFEIDVSSRNFAGKKLSEVNLGEGCTVVVVFRGGLAYRPNPDLTLEEGDKLGIVCGREVRATKKPFEEILVVVTNPKEKDEVFKEAEMLAERFDAELIYVYKSHGSVVASSEASDEIEHASVEEVSEVVKVFEGKVDLIVMDVPESFEALRSLGAYPVLLAKGKDDYESALVIVNTAEPGNLLNYASAISNFFGKTKVMFLDQEQLKVSSSMTESPKIEILLAHHNPLVEVVSEVRKGFDLVIFSAKNDVGNLSEGVLWRIVTKTESSVMVVE